MISSIRRFIASESAGGVVLALAAVVALVISNSTLGPLYRQFVEMRGELRIANDALVLSKPLLLWVNDLWMAVFFFVVGLEIKREVLAGELASVRQASLPAAAALGGMVVPALIYVALNHADAVALRGWAIPTATDIAFALGILMLLGSRVPVSLKACLTAVAIIDDLGAILVIALFYTAQLSPVMLLAAGGGIVLLWLLNRARVMHIGPYAEEASTIMRLHAFIRELGFSFDGHRHKHHEIYLGDPRRSASERLHTIIRQPYATQ